jgi:hypothetical protein
MTIIVQSMGILLVELNFRRRIYPEVHLLAKLFQNIKSIGFLPFRKIQGPQDSRMILKNETSGPKLDRESATRLRVRAIMSWRAKWLAAYASVADRERWPVKPRR